MLMREKEREGSLRLKVEMMRIPLPQFQQINLIKFILRFSDFGDGNEKVH